MGRIRKGWGRGGMLIPGRETAVMMIGDGGLGGLGERGVEKRSGGDVEGLGNGYHELAQSAESPNI